METGTGKTYVYLRTAQELFRSFGLRKFIVVVPSIAVREGVLSTLRLTHKQLKGCTAIRPIVSAFTIRRTCPKCVPSRFRTGWN